MHSQASRLGAPLLMVLLATGVSPRFVSAETRVVLRGESLQAALNAAVPGDVILLEPGAEFVGNFVLPVKTGDAPIVVRTAPSAQLPAETIRVRPEHAPFLAKIRSNNAAATLRTAAGAHHWELRHLEFRANLNGYGDIIQIGDGSSSQDTLAEVPHHIVLGHVYVHGHELYGQKRCIALNAAHVTIRDSHISDCKGVGVDTQAIGGWNGPGPYVIENNYLEATGENFLLGGADPAIANLVADDVKFRRNHVSRPLEWRDPIIPAPQAASATAESTGTLAAGTYAYRVIARRSVGQGTIGRSSPSAEVSATVADGGAVRISWEPVPDATEYRVYGRTTGSQGMFWTVKTTSFLDRGSAATSGAVPLSSGTVWSVKNLFELKSARNVIIEDNIFENHWKESQPGYAIVLTPRNSGGGCTWCVVEHVRFEHNVLRHVAAGFNILGYDSPSRPTKQTNDIIIRNNLIYDMGQPYGGNGWFLLIGDQPRDIVIDHNTIANSGNAIMFVYGGSKSAPKQITGVRFTNNAARHSTYGINGEFFSYGIGIIQGFFPGGTVEGNYLAGGSTSRYPSGNRTSGLFEQEYEDAASGDFRLRPTSQLRRAATDGGDIGADVPTVEARVLNVIEGIPTTGVVRAPTGLRIVSFQQD